MGIKQRFPDPLNRPDFMTGGKENDGALLSFEELMRGVGVIYEPQYTTTTVDHSSGRADCAVEHATPNDCNGAPTPEAPRGRDERGETTESSDGALEAVRPVSSGEEKEKADTGDGHSGVGHNGDREDRYGDRSVRRRSCSRILKHTAGNTGLNEEGNDVARSGKVRRTGYPQAVIPVYRV
ncbi:MAG: hypothetical protein Q9217_006374 [Psora testacea]